MASFIAESFIPIRTKKRKISQVYGTIYCIELVSEKTCEKSFNNVPIHLNPTVNIRICMVLINGCGSSCELVLEASIQWKTHQM